MKKYGYCFQDFITSMERIESEYRSLVKRKKLRLFAKKIIINIFKIIGLAIVASQVIVAIYCLFN